MYNKNYSNKTVIRKDNKAGEFTTIPLSIVNDMRLSSKAYRILTSILSDADSFNLTYKLIQNRFGYCENTVRVAFKLLEECGYMRIIPIEKGRGNKYIISEYGNLNTDAVEEFKDTDMKQTSTKHNVDRAEKNKSLFEDYIKSIGQFLEIDSVFERLTKLQKEHIDKNGFIDFYPIKNKLDKAILKEKKRIYKICMEVTTRIGKNTSKKAISEYSNWLKEQVFEQNNLSFDFEKKWTYIKIKHTSYKSDYETQEYDRREQEWEDLHG